MQLTVHIVGSPQEDRILATMFDVATPDGTLIGQGTASPLRPATIDLPDTVKRVYVIGYSPTGQKAQQAVQLDAQRDVHLEVAHSPHEWLQWVAPFRSLSHLFPQPAGTRAASATGPVWMVLWELREGHWTARAMPCTELQQVAGVGQVTIEVAPDVSSVLQVGGDKLAWRLISLPPGGPVRVAVTPNPADFAGKDPVEVTVARVRPMNELIMSYLSRGAVVEADRLGQAWESADLALFEKMQDPVSAAAGAYLLLKINRLAPDREWVQHLVDWFPFLPDGPIVAAALELQGETANEEAVRKLIGLAVARGLPVFGLGVSILLETIVAIHRGADETPEMKAIYRLVNAYDQARAARGAYFAFYGQSPEQPSWHRFTGPPDAPVAAAQDTARWTAEPENFPVKMSAPTLSWRLDVLATDGASVPTEASDLNAARARHAFQVLDEKRPGESAAGVVQ